MTEQFNRLEQRVELLNVQATKQILGLDIPQLDHEDRINKLETV
jgi:hypothetical protein